MNPLTDLLPAKARAVLYAVVAAAAFVFALWQAANGDWAQFAAAVIAALTGALAGSNVSTAKDEPKEEPTPRLATGGLVQRTGTVGVPAGTEFLLPRKLDTSTPAKHDAAE